MIEAPYIDLLKTPYLEGGFTVDGGLDCLGVCYVILTRLGLDLDQKDMPLSYASTKEALALMQDGLWDRWTRVGVKASDASELGDVIYSITPCGKHHVSALVRSKAPKLSLTSLRGYGVRAIPVSRLTNVVGVYRLRA